MTSRLNARIDRELARKVAYLREHTQSTTTEVVKASIEAMFERVSRQRPLDLLADFVGCASGDSDLSQNYKAELTQSLARKAPIRLRQDASSRRTIVKKIGKRKSFAQNTRKRRAQP